MTSIQLILTSYLLISSLVFIMEMVLLRLNYKSIVTHKNSIPEYAKTFISPDQYKASVSYNLDVHKFGFIRKTISFGILVLLVLSGVLGNIQSFVYSFNPIRGFAEVIYFVAIAAIFTIVSMPFQVYRQFVLEAKHGFNTMTVRLFASDLIKNLLLSMIIGLPVLWVLFKIVAALGVFWWLYAYGFIVLIQFAIVFIYPVLIAPIFNKFSPLEDCELKDKIENLCQQLNFKSNGVFTMDGSKRSRHSNAYFTGLGNKKRIVLFDTLLEQLETDELLAVLAHELGHFKKKHIIKRMAVSLVELLFDLFLISLLLQWPALFHAFGFTNFDLSSVLVLVLFFSGPVTFFLEPLSNIWSRKHEFEADAFAVKHVNNKQYLINALCTLGKDNKKNLTPHPLYSFMYFSHPGLAERIQAINVL